MNVDARELLDFEPGGDLYVRDRASPSAAERNVTSGITKGQGDVRDVEPSYDGTRILFALHEPLVPGAESRGPADLGRVGIRRRDRRAAPPDPLGHRRPPGQRRRTTLPSRRARGLQLDPPAPVEGDPARRRQATVRRAGREPQRAGVRAARHARRRHRHPAGLLQPEPRPRSGRAGRRQDRLHALGQRARARRDERLCDAARRQRARAAVRREQPPDRHRRLDGAVPRSASDGQRPPAGSRPAIRRAGARRRAARRRVRELRGERTADRAESWRIDRARAEAGDRQRRADGRGCVARRSVPGRISAARRYRPAAGELDAVPTAGGNANRPRAPPTGSPRRAR